MDVLTYGHDHIIKCKIACERRATFIHELEHLVRGARSDSCREPGVPLIPALGPERGVRRAAIVRPCQLHRAHARSVHVVLEAHRGHAFVAKVAVHAELDPREVGVGGLGVDVEGSIIRAARTS